MAILGNNTQTGNALSAAPGRKVSGKFNLAAPQQLQEIHAWVYGGTLGNTVTLHVYADSSGSPGARVAYTSTLATPSDAVSGGSIVEISQTGFAIALSAGDYWLGITFTTNAGHVRGTATGTLKAILGGATVSPPSDPYGTTDYSSSTDKISVWAVVATAGPPVTDFTGTPLSGAAPLSVAFTDTSTNTPTSWAWDFGDGTTSTSQNPSHSYVAGGVYTVALTATNASGSNTKTRTAYVTATEAIALVSGGGIGIY